jgi:hypothetical protein
MNSKLLTLLSATGIALTTQVEAFVEEENILEESSHKMELVEDISLEDLSPGEWNGGCDGGCTSNSGC